MPEAVPTDVTVNTDVGPATIPDLDSFPPTGTPIHPKLSSWDLYRSIGSPQRVVAPMVDQSELPWRILSRRYGSELVYTPMINAKLFADENSKKKKVKYQEVNFNKEFAEEGATSLSLTPASSSSSEPSISAEGRFKDTDRPLFVQFCANDPSTLLRAAQVVEDRCNAVDLNLGCPQHIARRGHYGSYLMEDWPLIFSLINILHINLKVPVTAKMRVYESVEETVAYARMLERAGAQIVTVHGRTRNMKGHHTGLADWNKIRAVKEAVKVPVFANGNVLYPQDFYDALAATGAKGIMSAEGNLYNPAVFMKFLASVPSRMFPNAPALPFPSIVAMAHEYLDIVTSLRTPTQSSAIKAHLFRLCRPALEVHRDLREQLGKARFDDKAVGPAKIVTYRQFLTELERRLEEDMKSGIWEKQPDPPLPGSVSHLTEPNGEAGRPAYIPHWLAQPYFRPPLVPGEPGGKEADKVKAEKKADKGDGGKSAEMNGDIQIQGEGKVARGRSGSAEAEGEGEKKKAKLNDDKEIAQIAR